jgi:hypothetical protein
VETEDVVNVLRNVEQAVVPGGRVLDAHPLGIDMAVRAGSRGLGFVDARRFGGVIAAMDEGVAEVEAEGLLTHLRTVRRHVVERFDDPAEMLDEVETWKNLRLPAAVSRRLAKAEERPIEFVDTVRYRLFATPG